MKIREGFGGEACGIPPLAKNERDMGHPALVARIESEVVCDGSADIVGR
jgi:hypothetical protein